MNGVIFSEKLRFYNCSLDCSLVDACSQKVTSARGHKKALHCCKASTCALKGTNSEPVRGRAEEVGGYLKPRAVLK